MTPAPATASRSPAKTCDPPLTPYLPVKKSPKASFRPPAATSNGNPVANRTTSVRTFCERSKQKNRHPAVFWRRERDSNPRYPFQGKHAFQACAFNHSATSPKVERENLSGFRLKINRKAFIYFIFAAHKSLNHPRPGLKILKPVYCDAVRSINSRSCMMKKSVLVPALTLILPMVLFAQDDVSSIFDDLAELEPAPATVPSPSSEPAPAADQPAPAPEPQPDP